MSFKKLLSALVLGLIATVTSVTMAEAKPACPVGFTRMAPKLVAVIDRYQVGQPYQAGQSYTESHWDCEVPQGTWYILTGNSVRDNRGQVIAYELKVVPPHLQELLVTNDDLADLIIQTRTAAGCVQNTSCPARVEVQPQGTCALVVKPKPRTTNRRMTQAQCDARGPGLRPGTSYGCVPVVATTVKFAACRAGEVFSRNRFGFAGNPYRVRGGFCGEKLAPAGRAEGHAGTPDAGPAGRAEGHAGTPAG